MAKKKTAGTAAPGDAASATPPAAPRRRRVAATPAPAPASTADDRAEPMPEPAGQRVTPDNTSTSDSVTFPAASSAGLTYEQIADAAYRRYLNRGGQHGGDFDDWIEAERELKSK